MSYTPTINRFEPSAPPADVDPLAPSAYVAPSAPPVTPITIEPSAPPMENPAFLNIDIDYKNVVLFAITLLAFLVIDILFVWMVTGPMYNKMVPQIQGTPLTLRFLPTIMLYAIMTFALFYFVILPKNGDLSNLNKNDLISAGLLGLVIFSAFNLTNVAIFQNYSPFIAVLDTAWGTSLFVLVTMATSFIYSNLDE